MSIRTFRTLVAVADAKTFSAAADIVHVTHAAVSQQMRSLEADLGVALFDRRTRTPELTPVGRQVVEKARQIIADYDNLMPSVLSDGGLEGVIRLGAIGTTLTGLAPKALARLKAAYPKIGLHIRPGLTGALLADIERGLLDAAIVTKPPQLSQRLELRELSEEPLELIASEREVESDPMQLLSKKPYIRFNRTAVLGGLIDDWLSKHNIEVDETMELDSAEAINSMVEADLGVSIVPNLAVGPATTGKVKRIAIGPDAPVRKLALAYRKDHTKVMAIDALHVALVEAISGTTIQSE